MNVYSVWPWCITIVITAVYCREQFVQQKESLNLMDFLQPDDVDTYYKFAPESDLKSCTRKCKVGSPPRICYYRFVLEKYRTMSSACENCKNNNSQCFNHHCVTADGFRRGILVVNRRIPGPPIQVCYGDRIIVDVTNKMTCKSTVIHWHGIFQKGTPYYDGVPMVSQCPITRGTTFRYDFYAKQCGTFFWHSHDGIQKVDGLQGAIIIRCPKENDPSSGFYDHDLPTHTMFIQDWIHTDSSDHIPGLSNPDMDLYKSLFLINGKGRFRDSRGEGVNVPYTVLRVTRGKSYRLRVICALCFHCSARIQVEAHQLTLIATDGNAVKPRIVECFDCHSGYRFDFVLNATNAVNSYWIKVKGYGPCADQNAYQLAILQYKGAKYLEPLNKVNTINDLCPNGLVLRLMDATIGYRPHAENIAQLESAIEVDKGVTEKEPDISFTLTFGYHFPSTFEEFYNNSYHRYFHPEPKLLNTMFWVNHISQQLPSSPIISQLSDIPLDLYCETDERQFPICKQVVCRCLHIIRIPLNSTVEFILIDQSLAGGLEHPFHLHGFAFCVMAMGYMVDVVNKIETIKGLQSSAYGQSSAPILKDTIAVPAMGFSVLRLRADNPGYWPFHCHFNTHIDGGMRVLVQVGEPEDLPPVPEGFTKCGNFPPRK